MLLHLQAHSSVACQEVQEQVVARGETTPNLDRAPLIANNTPLNYRLPPSSTKELKIWGIFPPHQPGEADKSKLHDEKKGFSEAKCGGLPWEAW